MTINPLWLLLSAADDYADSGLYPEAGSVLALAHHWPWQRFRDQIQRRVKARLDQCVVSGGRLVGATVDPNGRLWVGETEYSLTGQQRVWALILTSPAPETRGCVACDRPIGRGEVSWVLQPILPRGQIGPRAHLACARADRFTLRLAA